MKKLLSISALFFFTFGLNAQIGFNEILIDDITMNGATLPADMDGDGDVDIVTHGLKWYENLDGQGTFAPPQDISSNGPVSNLFVADMDGDGDMDVCTSGTSFIRWYENFDGVGGDFVTHSVEYDMELEEIVKIAISDFDGDGNNDIMYQSESNDYGDRVGWLRSDGAGNFDFGGTLNTNNETKTVHFTDADGDGDLDVIMEILWPGDLDQIYIIENEGGVIVQTHTLIDMEPYTHYSLYATDIDGDGDNDIIHGLPNVLGGGITWFENVNGVYQAPEVFFEIDLTINYIYMADIDNDGALDLIYFNSGTNWRKNTDGQGNFGEELLLSNMAGLTLYFADFNGDSAIDFYMSRSIFLNIGPLENQITGNLRLDIENDGCDETDIPIPNVLVTTDNGSNAFSTFTDNNGFYSFLTNPGTFTTIIENPSTDVYAVSPAFHTSEFPELDGVDVADFCLDVLQEINDVNIILYNQNGAVPGFEANYRMYYRNVGSTVLNGSVSLSFDEEKLNFENSSLPIGSQSSGTITFDYSNFLPFQSAFIDVTFLVESPPITEIDDILVFTTQITPIVGDNTENDNTYTREQVVVGSYDPNDIIVLEGEEIYLEQADDYLHYMIRFQNVGTAYATFIRVTNILDEDLDWTTLQVESISHDYSIEIIDGNDITFFFDAIYLPDSTTNEEESHGFITYKIKPKNPAALGDEFTNNANIYFDFNPPVITNTVTTTIVEDLSVSENELENLLLYPNPSEGIINIQSTTTITTVEVFNQIGQLIVEENNLEGIKTLDLNSFNEGLYFVKLKDENSNFSIKKVIKQ